MRNSVSTLGKNSCKWFSELLPLTLIFVASTAPIRIFIGRLTICKHNLAVNKRRWSNETLTYLYRLNWRAHDAAVHLSVQDAGSRAFLYLIANNFLPSTDSSPGRLEIYCCYCSCSRDEILPQCRRPVGRVHDDCCSEDFQNPIPCCYDRDSNRARLGTIHDWNANRNRCYKLGRSGATLGSFASSPCRIPGSHAVADQCPASPGAVVQLPTKLGWC